MIKIISQVVCISVVFGLGGMAAGQSPERRPESLYGISSVFVTVSNKSSVVGMPVEAVLQTQIENLVQTKCNLTIAHDKEKASAEIHIDLVVVTLPVRGSNTKVPVAVVRTSVWRDASLAALDEKGTNAPMKNPVRMTGWVLSTISDPLQDPLLSKAISAHIEAIATTLRAGGQPIMPTNFSESFFASRESEIKNRIETLINEKLWALPGIDKNATKISVSLRFENGVLKYTFHGPLKYAPSTVTTDDVNVSGRLDLAAQSAIGSLPESQVCLVVKDVPPQCITIKQIFE